eukprot:12116068-Ditylum_brightwellii.AAC.1
MQLKAAAVEEVDAATRPAMVIEVKQKRKSHLQHSLLLDTRGHQRPGPYKCELRKSSRGA